MAQYERQLSEIDVRVDGFTPDDVVRERKLRNEAIRAAALRGNNIAIQAEELLRLAKSLNSYAGSEYEEDYWEENEDFGMF